MALGVGMPALKSSPGERGEHRNAVDAVQVPSFFLCPIRLAIMKDPVTLSTGMTYDRRSIEKWLDAGHNTCPTTNQILESHELIPNHTLRRAIQTWRAVNPAPPRKGVDDKTVQIVLDTISQCTDASAYHNSLKHLYTIAEECRRNRKTLKEAGAVPVLIQALNSLGAPPDRIHPRSRHSTKALDYAVTTLAMLDQDNEATVSQPTLTILCSILATGGSSQAKLSAAQVIHSACGDDLRLKAAVGMHPGVIDALVTLLRDEKLTPSQKKLGLRCLLSLSLPKKNRIIAVTARAVDVLVDLLPKTDSNTRVVEYACAIMEVLANSPEGRESISNHPFAIPRLVAALVGVSPEATEHAVGALLVVIELASNRGTVINTALQAGAFTKLLMVLPGDSSQRAKSKSRDALKLLNDAWATFTLEDNRGATIDSSSLRHHRPHFS